MTRPEPPAALRLVSGSTYHQAGHSTTTWAYASSPPASGASCLAARVAPKGQTGSEVVFWRAHDKQPVRLEGGALQCVGVLPKLPVLESRRRRSAAPLARRQRPGLSLGKARPGRTPGHTCGPAREISGAGCGTPGEHQPPGTGIRGRNSHADEFAGLLLFLVSVIAAIIKSSPAAPAAPGAFPSRAACVLSRAACVLSRAACALSRAARVLAGGRAVVL